MPRCEPTRPAGYLVRRVLAVAGVLALLAGCTPADRPATPAPEADARAAAVLTIVRDTMAAAHLKAAIVRVTQDGKEIVTQALGESMTGVPATPCLLYTSPSPRDS